MSTSYYFHTNRGTCLHCDTDLNEVIHLGQSAGGWKFKLEIHPYREPSITSWEDWLTFISKHPSGMIVDEYGEEISVAEMHNMVMDPSATLRRSHVSEYPCANYIEKNVSHLYRDMGTYETIPYPFD